MKKIIGGIFVLIFLASGVAYAETVNKKTIDTTCAIGVITSREDALTAAWITFNTKIEDSFESRKSGLIHSWELLEAKDRAYGIKKVWGIAKVEKKEAIIEYKKAKKAAWKKFKVAIKECGSDVAKEASSEKESIEKIEI